MEISSCFLPNPNALIPINFCTWHDSKAVVPCAKICSDIISESVIRMKSNLNCDGKGINEFRCSAKSPQKTAYMTCVHKHCNVENHFSIMMSHWYRNSIIKKAVSWPPCLYYENLYTAQCSYNAVSLFQNSHNKTPLSSPMMARYGMSFLISNSHLWSASVLDHVIMAPDCKLKR